MRAGLVFTALVAALVAGCAPSTTTRAATRAAVAPSPSTEAPRAEPTGSEIITMSYVPHTVQTVTSRTAVSIVDVAPARAASASLPAGSVYIAGILLSDPGAYPGDPTVLEWDVARGRVLAEKVLSKAGELPQLLRLTTAGERVYVLQQCSSDCDVRLTVLDRSLEVITERTLSPGDDVSIEADERHVAVAVARHSLPARPLTVTLFDARSLVPIAKTVLAATGGPMSGYARGDVLELAGDRLFVAGMPPAPSFERNLDGVVVGVAATIFALDLPSLTVRSAFTAEEGGGSTLRLFARAGGVYLHSYERLTELTRELRFVRTTDVEGISPTFGPDGRLFSGGEAWQMRELFPGAFASCTSAWSGSEPLLVCSGDEGVRIARLRPGDAHASWVAP